uniref:Uncharacterized protein n=1 Tax=Pyrodinium bahamense TaxID=73915 RepID=A0A7S0FB51_9DINO
MRRSASDAEPLRALRRHVAGEDIRQAAPGYTGHVPAHLFEAPRFSSTGDSMRSRSVTPSPSTHALASFELARQARGHIPGKALVFAQGRTLLAPTAAYMLNEVPIRDSTRSWSAHGLAGAHVEAAGRIAPSNRQQVIPLLRSASAAPTPSYTGSAPGGHQP